MRAAVLLLLVASGAAAQTPEAPQNAGRVFGTVTDQRGDPLPGANVLVMRSGTPIGTAADLDGQYNISGLPLGPVRLRASFVGFRTVEIDTVATAEGVRVDFVLAEECFDGEIVTVYNPPGDVMDLAAIGYSEPHGLARDGRPTAAPDWEPLAARVARTPVWDRGADALGRWQPLARGGLAPEAYVGGLRALSLEAVPRTRAAPAGVMAGYAPVRYSGAGGAVDVGVNGGRERGARLAGGAAETGPLARAEADVFSGLSDPLDCYRPVRSAAASAEAAALALPREGIAQGRAMGAFREYGPEVRVTARGAGARGLERADAPGLATLGATAEWATARGDWTASAGADGLWRDGSPREGAPPEAESAAVASGRVEYRTWRPDVALGVDASALRRRAGDRRIDETALAAYAQLWAEGLDVGRTGFARLSPGLRVERFRTASADTSRGVWTVQPRVLATLRTDRVLAHAYGALFAQPTPEAALLRRAQAGAHARMDLRPVDLGLGGYVRRWSGPLVGTTAGVDGSLAARLPIPGVAYTTAIARLRHEWGNAALARSRATAWVEIETGYTPLVFEGVYILGADVGEGVGGTAVVEVFGEWAPRSSRLSFHARGLVSGRGAVPCAGWGGLPTEACPAPLAEAALTVAL